jgi:hypothetical protein
MSEIMLNNIIKYYAKVSDMALTNLAQGKQFQFRKMLTNHTLMQATKDYFEKIHRSDKANELINNYVQSMNNMHKIAQKEYNQVLAKIKATNDQILKQKLLNDYAMDGIHGFKAKNGAMWNIETYSNMYTTQVNNELLRLSVIENSKSGKVLISTHGTECDLCTPFEGKVLTLKELDRARSEGLFHVRCMHYVIEINQ